MVARTRFCPEAEVIELTVSTPLAIVRPPLKVARPVQVVVPPTVRFWPMASEVGIEKFIELIDDQGFATPGFPPRALDPPLLDC